MKEKKKPEIEFLESEIHLNKNKIKKLKLMNKMYFYILRKWNENN